jgi:hypothetical protein
MASDGEVQKKLIKKEKKEKEKHQGLITKSTPNLKPIIEKQQHGKTVNKKSSNINLRESSSEKWSQELLFIRNHSGILIENYFLSLY